MADVPITFRPLTQWPAGRARTPAHQREEAKFKTPGRSEGSGTPSYRYIPPKPMSIERTYDDLDRELWTIGAKEVVVQVDVGEQDLRRDGRPRANQRPNSPAVVLTFKRRGTLHTFACDLFTRWEDNLRGIALGLEGLRRLERYGIVQSGEQYRGWQALPSSTTPALGIAAAAEVLSARSSIGALMILNDFETALRAARVARAKAHPDAGGNDREFVLVQEAARVLSAHHGLNL